MVTPRILLLDRANPARDKLTDTLREEGYEVASTDDLEEALECLRDETFGLFLGEHRLTGPALAEALSLPEGPPVILLDDFASIQEAVCALESGVFDTIVRPTSEEEILITVRRALEQRALRDENRRLRSAIGERFELGTLVSRDPRMQRVFETIESVADSRVSILIQGESGTGKTVLARTIHNRSSTPEAPFVVVNCGALPSSLLESELFGHARGAFTGAIRDHKGKFETADGGTIFLDEIATAPHDLQVKLLRVIEEGRFERVGESTTRQVDVRVIAATNCMLPDEVAAGRFRADLYYRINVVGILVPPLRERTSDIPLLAQRFLDRFRTVHGRSVEGFAPDTITALCARPWPGNVRELENTIERGVLLSRSQTLASRDLWPDGVQEALEGSGTPQAEPGSSFEALPRGRLKKALEIPERWLILRALRESDGNRQDAARTLGINRTTLFNKMRKYGLFDESSAPSPKSEGERFL